MEITPEIVEALCEVKRVRGNMEALAKTSGVPQSYLSKYASGKCREMRLSTWKLLCPHLFTKYARDVSHNRLEIKARIDGVLGRMDYNQLLDCLMYAAAIAAKK